MKRALMTLVAGILAALITGNARAQTPVKAILTSPPLVPPPIERAGAAKAVVELTTTEVKGTLANDVEYTGSPFPWPTPLWNFKSR